MNQEGKFNVLTKNSFENYIGVFWGCKKSELQANKLMLERFENRQKERFGLKKEQELKSTIIKPKNYKYGVRSFNKTTMVFYKDFFELLDAINPVIQINAVSKIEYFLRKVFERIEMPSNYYFNQKVFYYTLTKLMIVYHNEELLYALYNIHDYDSVIQFLKLLKFNIQCILKATMGIERKEREINAYEQLYKVLSLAEIKIDKNIKYDFAYFINFEGLLKLLDERDIDVEHVELTIDQEVNTYNDAQMYPFSCVCQGDSKDIIQLRMSDILSGFIAHMMYAISNDESKAEDKVNDIRKINENDLSTKRLISKEWFDITYEQFKLYIRIYETLIVPHQEYWTCMTLSYGDKSVSFFALIQYFAQYKDYENFKKIDLVMHTEYYNSCCLEELERHYMEFY